VAKVLGRGRTRARLIRLRRTCALAFGAERPDLTVVSVPIVDERPLPALASWSGVEGDPARYDIEAVIEREQCEVTDGKPRWYCAVGMWQGPKTDVRDALDELFIDTRYVEWLEKDDPQLAALSEPMVFGAKPEVVEPVPDDGPR